MRLREHAKRVVSFAMATAMMLSMSLPAFAAKYNLSTGSVTIKGSSDGQTVTQENNDNANGVSDNDPVVYQDDNKKTANTVTIDATEGDAKVTLKDVNIDVSDTGNENDKGAAGKAAIEVNIAESKTVTIELKGDNIVQSGHKRAGVEVKDGSSGTLVIQDDDDDGKLTAKGGLYGAGIGGGHASKLAGDITITGGTINATGGNYGAGIGGGNSSSSSKIYSELDNITISGGKITAKGGKNSAGIGGGNQTIMNGDISITGGTIISAEGGEDGAGIGGGYNSAMNGDIIITGSTINNAKGGKYGAGIGGGDMSTLDGDIIITNSTINATGGYYGAGIGGGDLSETDSNNKWTGDGNFMNGNITITNSTINAKGGYYGAGIGGGFYSKLKGNITISDSTINAEGGRAGAGIGGGNRSKLYGSITISESDDNSDRTVNATGGLYAASIGAGGAGDEGKYGVNEGKISILGYVKAILKVVTAVNDKDEPTSYDDGYIGNGTNATGTQYSDSGTASYVVDCTATINDTKVGTAAETFINKIFPTKLSESALTIQHGKSETDASIEPTCTDTGLTEGTHCSVCGAVLTAQETIAATGHTSVTDARVEPTCTDTGLTEGTHCSVCGEILTAQEIIPATGHTWNDGEVTTEATTNTEGVMTYTCTVCGATMTESIPMIVVADDGEPAQTEALPLSFECVNITAQAAGEDYAEPYTAVAENKDVIVTSANTELPLEDTKFISSLEQLRVLADLEYERIIFVAQGTRYAFDISEILSVCSGTNYSVTYENGVAVLRGDMGGELTGKAV